MSSSRSHQQENQQNVSVDYVKLLNEKSENGVIINHLIQEIFRMKSWDMSEVGMLTTKFVAILACKYMVDEFKNFINGFKINNLTGVRYLYQRLTKKGIHVITLNYADNNWSFDTTLLDNNKLSNHLERGGFELMKDGSCYITFRGYIFRVTRKGTKITIVLPSIKSLIVEYEDFLHNQQIIKVGKNTICQRMYMDKEIPKIVGDQVYYVYETKNYTDLKNKILNDFETRVALNFQMKPFVFSFNGKPGTGKTSFTSYFAQQDRFDVVLRINMMQMYKMSFDKIIEQINRWRWSNQNDKGNGEKLMTMMIIFDEIDKWLKAWLTESINEMQEDKVYKGSAGRDQNGNTTGQSVSVTAGKVFTPEQKVEKINELKESFCNVLQQLIDGDKLEKVKYSVVIFNSNDFEYLFDGVNDNLAVPLKRRFNHYTFNYIGYDDVKDFIKDIARKKGVELDEQRIFDKINKDIAISYRYLSIMLSDCYFDFERFSNALAAYDNSNPQ
jgi:hypothetical protein